MNITNKYDIIERIVSKDYVKKHLFDLYEAGALGKINMDKKALKVIDYHLSGYIFRKIVSEFPEETDQIGRSCQTLCSRIAMKHVKEIMADCNYTWPKL